jgi:hypothetical protein
LLAFLLHLPVQRATATNRRFQINEEEGTMKCYVCAKLGVDKDAVAICIICGMGLCMGHAFKEELLVKDIIDWGFGEEQITYPHTLPRFICAECKLAREQKMKGSKGKG